MTKEKKTLKRILSSEKLLIRLGQRKTELIQCGSCDRSADWCLVKRVENKRSIKTGIVSNKLVQDLLARGDCEHINGGLRLTKAGRASLKRQVSNSGECFGQHRDVKLKQIDIRGSRRAVSIDLTESPLNWLATRRGATGRPFLDDYQLQVGERLRADFENGLMRQKITADWDSFAAPKNSNARQSFEGLSHSDRSMIARENVQRAIDAVGPELSGILIDVCCHLNGVEEAEKKNGWPKRSGKIILRLALTCLARHYGLVGDTDDNMQRRKKYLHWGAHDFRPSMDGEGQIIEGSDDHAHD